LPQKESKRKGEMPQNKNLTQISLSERGFGKRNGVNNAGKKIAYKGNKQAVSKGRKKEKTCILNELVKTTGYNRKYILHVLANWGKTTTVRMSEETIRLKASPKKRRKGGGRKPVYTDEFAVSFRAVWIFFRYRCGKILAPFIRSQMKHLEPAFHITPEVRELLLNANPATIDRKLKEDRKKLALKGRSLTKPGNLLKKQIPVRTYYADKKPGFFEIDTVRHCGTNDSGEFFTLTATDVYSGWVELRPLLNKAHKWILQALLDIKSSLQFPISGIDSDNGSEFINSALLKWCRDERIQFTRTRAYHKNDNCYVEQKNYSCVRAFAGYDRFSTTAELDALSALYSSLCPLINFFIPSEKLISKTRLGSKIRKVYDKQVLSPYQRLLACPDVSDEVKARLVKRSEIYNPVVLQREVHEAVDVLTSLKRGSDLEEPVSLVTLSLHASNYG